MDEKPRIARRVAWGLAASLFLVGAVAAAVWFSGHTVWTDGQLTRVAGSDARLRDVLWAAPKALDPDLNSADQQYEPSPSPDGTELYFVRGKPGRGAHIYVSYRRDNAWTAPAPVKAVNGPTDDLGPRVTPDGRFLTFSSDRPGGVGGYDLWAAPREQGGWGAPFNLGPGVNTEFNELNPDPTPDGRRLIFSTNRKAAGRQQAQAWRGTIRESDNADYDLWSATLAAPVSPDPSTQPTTAPTTRPGAIPAALAFKDAAEIQGVNTSASEGASCMSPAGDFLYFASNRAGGAGKFDIYRCRVRDGERVGPVENVGPPINTADNEADPSMALAGFRIYFSSDRNSPAGVYTLHTSDSHEVYRVREGRPFPRLGWSLWSLLLSALLLIPLILALRGIEGRHLNTLQRCLVLSLLLHAATTFILSFVMVSRDVVRSIGRGTGGEIALNLNLPNDVEIGLAVRGQLSSASELPVTVAEPAPVARVAQATPAGDAEPVRVAVPTATAVPARSIELPQTAIPAKPIMTGDVRTTARVDPAALTVPMLLADVGPAPVAAKVAQAGAAAPVPAEGQLPDVPRADISPPKEVRPTGDLVGTTPGVAVGAAMTALSPPPPPTAIGTAALPAHAPTVAPRAAVSDGSPGLAIPNLPTQTKNATRLNTGSSPSLPVAESPATATRLQTAASDTGGAPKDVEPVATPLRPTTAPTGTAVAFAPSTRPARIDPVVASDSVQPASATAAGPDAALPPSLPAGTLSTSPKAAPVRATTESPRGSDVSRKVARQAAASPTAVAAPQLPVTPAPAAVAASQREASRLPDITSISPSRPVGATGIERVAPAASSSLAPLEIASAAVPVPSAPAPAPSSARPSGASPAADQAQKDAGPVLASQRVETAMTPATPDVVATASAPPPVAVQQSKPLASPSGRDGGPTSPLPVASATAVVNPDATLAALPALNLPATPGIVTAPASSPFPRSLEQRQPRIEKLGGNEKSESAVDRGLAYLATQQERDGRWTLVLDNSRPTGRRPKSYHDMANTGLAVLAFLARNNSPNKAGPYSEAVAKGLDYLVEQQEENGDLRGPPHLRGEGSRRGDMYDHAIATLALAEAALMTGGDKRYTEAALSGARFIVAAQDPRSGGWRYIPGEYGDSSVFGWQVMALHAVEQLGFQTPDRTRQLAARYIGLASRGERKMLAGYQPGKAPTPTMTAEILYGRMLLGQKLEPEDIREATDYLADQPPDPREPSLYYWYYASLCMLQIQSPEWKEWNARTRDALIALQSRGGATDGSWDADPRYAERGGRVYMTAIAVLTLEVYYRYLPLLDRTTPAPR